MVGYHKNAIYTKFPFDYRQFLSYQWDCKFGTESYKL